MNPSTIPDKLPILRSVDIAEDALSLARIPDSDEVFVGAFNGVVYYVDLGAESPQPKQLLGGHISYVSGIAQWKDIVVSAGSDRRLVWWNRITHEKMRVVEQAHSKWIRDITVHPQQGILASVGDDMVCRLWDMTTGDRIADLIGHAEITPQLFRNKLFTCEFSRDGKLLATADQTGHVAIWDFESKAQVAVIEATKLYEWDNNAEALNGHSYGGVRAMDFSPDGQRLAIAGVLNTDAAITNGQALLQVYDWKSANMIAEYTDGGKFFYENVRFHHTADWIVAAPGAGSGNHFNFLNAQEPKLIKKSEGFCTYDMVLNETSDVMYVVGPQKIAKLGVYAEKT